MRHNIYITCTRSDVTFFVATVWNLTIKEKFKLKNSKVYATMFNCARIKYYGLWEPILIKSNFNISSDLWIHFKALCYYSLLLKIAEIAFVYHQLNPVRFTAPNEIELVKCFLNRSRLISLNILMRYRILHLYRGATPTSEIQSLCVWNPFYFYQVWTIDTSRFSGIRNCILCYSHLSNPTYILTDVVDFFTDTADCYPSNLFVSNLETFAVIVL